MLRGLRLYLSLLRVRQWHKNTFVLLGLFLVNNRADATLVLSALNAFLAFCLASSAVYIFNDFRDRENDRLHPVKRHRPLAAGEISVLPALVLAGTMAVLALILASRVSPVNGYIVLLYLANNLFYSLWLKRLPLFDAFSIAFGFMLRIFSGTVGVGIFITQWLVVSGFMGSLLIAFAKRYSELARYETPEKHRSVLRYYSADVLRNFVSIMSSACIVTYALYTVGPYDGEGVAASTPNLVYTTPFVLFGILRFLSLVLTDNRGEDPASLVIRDKVLFLTAIGWALAYTVILRR